MLIRLFACAWALLCALTAEAATTPLPVPTVDYSADRTIESEAGTFTGRVRAAGGRERMELEFNGMKSVTILRPDRGLGWLLMPAQRMYRQLDLGQARRQSGGAPPPDVSIDVVGPETLDGLATTKYRLRMQDGSAGGFMWFTAEGIAVKMDLLAKERGRSNRVTVTLHNLVVGAQDAALFEVPADYTALPSFGGLTGALSGAVSGALSGAGGFGHSAPAVTR